MSSFTNCKAEIDIVMDIYLFNRKSPHLFVSLIYREPKYQIEEMSPYIIANNNGKKQRLKDLNATLKELNVFKHLINAGIRKSFGFSSAYLFPIIFSLIFEYKTGFKHWKEKKSFDCPAKNAVYHF